MKPTPLFSFKTVLLLIIVCCAIQISAQNISSNDNKEWLQKSSKTYSKTYSLNGENVVLKNKFGNIVIETWDKNEVKVDATITVGTDDNDYSNIILKKINIVDEKKTDSIKFETIIDPFNNEEKNYPGNQNLKINYTVHLPANAKLVAQNSFGLLSITDYKGEATLISRYGTLDAGKLDNAKLIKVEFGKAIIESVNNTDLNFRYSRIDIKKIAGNIEADIEFCNSVDFVMDNSVKKFDVTSKYTTIYLAMEKDAFADYDITTSNATVSSKSSIKIVEENKSDADASLANYNRNYKIVYSANHKYSGSIGKAGGTQITIKSSFGNVKII